MTNDKTWSLSLRSSSLAAIGLSLFALYDLIFSSTLTFDCRDRVCSFTGSNSSRGLPIHLRESERASERALVIPVDRFFVEDAQEAQPRIKLRELKREESRGGCHRIQKQLQPCRSVDGRPPLRSSYAACIRYESVDFMFYDCPWNQTALCLRCGCSGWSGLQLVVSAFFPNIRKRAKACFPWLRKLFISEIYRRNCSRRMLRNTICTIYCMLIKSNNKFTVAMYAEYFFSKLIFKISINFYSCINCVYVIAINVIDVE